MDGEQLLSREIANDVDVQRLQRLLPALKLLAASFGPLRQRDGPFQFHLAVRCVIDVVVNIVPVDERCVDVVEFLRCRSCCVRQATCSSSESLRHVITM